MATTEGEIVSVQLDPADPAACPEAVDAVRAADWVVLGPGSWFTSVIPHLMVPELRRAIGETDARILIVLNLEEQAGETGGFAPEDHLAALLEHAPELKVHTCWSIGAASPTSTSWSRPWRRTARTWSWGRRPR